jgi:hypothetical protein
MTWPEMIVAFSVPLWLAVEGIAPALDRLTARLDFDLSGPAIGAQSKTRTT